MNKKIQKHLFFQHLKKNEFLTCNKNEKNRSFKH